MAVLGGPSRQNGHPFCNGLSATWKLAVSQVLHKCLEMRTEARQECE